MSIGPGASGAEQGPAPAIPPVGRFIRSGKASPDLWARTDRWDYRRCLFTSGPRGGPDRDRTTIDPASLVVAVVASYASRQNRSGTFKLFDGVRRYNVAVTQTGFVDLAPPQQSHDGAATECQATPELIQAFPTSPRIPVLPCNRRGSGWPPVPGLPAIPVRHRGAKRLGADADLVAVK